MRNIELTKREIEILHLISEEYSTLELADALHISYETAKTHRKNLFIKLQAKNAAGLIRKAFEKGLLQLRYS